MIAKARQNASKLGFLNVEFIKCDIEDLPIESITADVVVSNCVLNMVPNKGKAFAHIFWVLKPGGHFSISDVVLVGKLPSEPREAAKMYAGCVSGAMQKKEYLDIIHKAGFKNTTIQKEKAIAIPDEIMPNFLNFEELKALKQSGVGIFRITVYGEK